MTASRKMARFNRRFTNKAFSQVAGWMPGFAIVVHTGRKSGKMYRTPVNAFSRDGEYIIALTYGPESEWVKNVLATGTCELWTRGRKFRMRSPRLVTDRRKRWSPLPVRMILSVIGAPQHMRLSKEEQR